MLDPQDVLIKSAEMIDPEHWCMGSYFLSKNTTLSGVFWANPDLLPEELLEEALASPRCVTGTVALATVLLGGKVKDFALAMGKLDHYLVAHCAGNCDDAIQHNDTCLSASDHPALSLRDTVREAAVWNGSYLEKDLSQLPVSTLHFGALNTWTIQMPMPAITAGDGLVGDWTHSSVAYPTVKDAIDSLYKNHTVHMHVSFKPAEAPKDHLPIKNWQLPHTCSKHKDLSFLTITDA